MQAQIVTLNVETRRVCPPLAHCQFTPLQSTIDAQERTTSLSGPVIMPMTRSHRMHAALGVDIARADCVGEDDLVQACGLLARLQNKKTG